MHLKVLILLGCLLGYEVHNRVSIICTCVYYCSVRNSLRIDSAKYHEGIVVDVCFYLAVGIHEGLSALTIADMGCRSDCRHTVYAYVWYDKRYG